jgi:hypothetical protein
MISQGRPVKSRVCAESIRGEVFDKLLGTAAWGEGVDVVCVHGIIGYGASRVYAANTSTFGAIQHAHRGGTWNLHSLSNIHYPT